jgi:hypothetical protein
MEVRRSPSVFGKNLIDARNVWKHRLLMRLRVKPG